MLVVTGSRNAEERVSVTASADKLIANKTESTTIAIRSLFNFCDYSMLLPPYCFSTLQGHFDSGRPLSWSIL
jgi:hypothetical protein